MTGVPIDHRRYNKLEQRLLVRVSPETLGSIYGLVGVILFSLTLPATRVAVRDLDPTIVGLGRALVASILAAIFLFASRQSFPSRAQLKSLFITAAGVVVAFPVLSAWAMRRVPAAHGAVTLGLLPLATAIGGKLRAGENPSRIFWIASAIGSASVVVFALVSGGGQIQTADLALLGSIVAAAIGYTEGGRLAREFGGAQVVCWALLVSAPFLVVPVAIEIVRHGLSASPAAWLGFAYVSVFSMFLGFFAWYHGLALGGIARVGQIQLLQPFLTIFASALLLSEPITLITIGFASAVVACVAVGRQASVRRS